MTILEHTNKIELLKLYKVDTFIGSCSSTWEHKHKKTLFCAWKLLILHVLSITIITFSLLPLWKSFIYGFVENWTLNLLKKNFRSKLYKMTEILRKYWDRHLFWLTRYIHSSYIDIEIHWFDPSKQISFSSNKR